MLSLAIGSVFAITGIAAVLTLVDTWLRAQSAWQRLTREQALLAAGFIVQSEPHDLRLRRIARPAFSPPRDALRRAATPLRLRVAGAA